MKDPIIALGLLSLFGIVPLIAIWYEKILWYDLRRNKTKLLAVVVDYHHIAEEFKFLGEPPAHYKKPIMEPVYFPYVLLDGSGENDIAIQLRYGFKSKMYFIIGQKVSVFWIGTELHYWDAYDHNWKRYFPSRWDFWKKD